MIALDTNVIVRYLVRDDLEQVPRADAVIESLDPENPGFVASIVLAELYWVLTRSYGVPASAVVGHIESLGSSDDIVVESAPALRYAVAAARDGSDFADALIAHSARRAGASAIVTFDHRASRTLGFRLI